MNIKIETENCSYDSNYLIEESANSRIIIHVEMEKIASLQSKKQVRDQITQLIQNELIKFKWIISGSVVVEFGWYLNAVERQETDKLGDIDNISKPIQDSLIGEKGILIDDSQIGGLYSFWMCRNDIISDNILRIDIKFNNDETLKKENLMFIQYDNAICMPLNIDNTDVNNLLGCKMFLHAKRKMRRQSDKVKKKGHNLDTYLKLTSWDFHRTRLGAFDKSKILSFAEFNDLCMNQGLTLKKLIELKKASCQHHV